MTKAADWKDMATEIVDSIGKGTSFDDVKERLVGALATEYENGQKSLEGVDVTQLDLRRTMALEKIADHLGAFRAHHLDEEMDVAKAREVLTKCADVLRFPRMKAQPELMADIRSLLGS